MELYLIKKKLLTFAGQPSITGGPGSADTRSSIRMEPVIRNASTEEFCNNLVKWLPAESSGYGASSSSSSGSPLFSWQLKMILTIAYEGNNTDAPYGSLKVLGLSPCLFTRLEELFGAEHLKLMLSFENLKFGRGPAVVDLPPTVVIVDNNEGAIEVVPLTTKFLGAWRSSFNNSNSLASCGGSSSSKSKRNQFFYVSLEGVFTIKLCLDDHALEKLYVPWSDSLGINRRMLHEKMFTDVVLVAEGGERVPSHKAILAGSSQVFMEMLEGRNRRPKAQQSILKIEEMSKPGVDALLAFIYCSEIQEASKSFPVAFELVQAGQKYKIGKLVDAMKHVILVKDHTWFSVDDAVRLVKFAIDVPELVVLKEKAVYVLKIYSQLDSEKLLTSEEYKLLFGNNPKVAMEVGALFLQFT